MLRVVTLPNNNKLLVSVVYRPPSSRENNSTKLIGVVSNIWEYQNCSYVLVMDVPGTDLQENMCLHYCMTVENKLFNVLFHVMDFTCHCPGQRSSTLDLVFIDNPNSIDSMQHYSHLGLSDDDCLILITNAMK